MFMASILQINCELVFAVWAHHLYTTALIRMVFTGLHPAVVPKLRVIKQVKG
jgi:hypothetical protein